MAGISLIRGNKALHFYTRVGIEDNTNSSPSRKAPGPRSQSFLKVRIILKLRSMISLLEKIYLNHIFA